MFIITKSYIVTTIRLLYHVCPKSPSIIFQNARIPRKYFRHLLGIPVLYLSTTFYLSVSTFMIASDKKTLISPEAENQGGKKAGFTQ